MQTITVHSFTPGDIPALIELQQAYSLKYPGAPVFPGELYLSPGFHGGDDVFCAFDGSNLVAYAPVYAQIVDQGPADLPHTVWTEIKAHPQLPNATLIKDLLLDWVTRHAQQLASQAPERELRLVFEYRPNEAPAVAYVQSRGFEYTESVFHMVRTLTQPIPAPTAPEGICLRRWKMESAAEQQAYVTARNECFPESPITLEQWQYLMHSPAWSTGTSIAAFDGGELVGNVYAYWDTGENNPPETSAGFTEDIFVRAGWRGKGIAAAMIAAGMRFLQEQGIREAHLSVRALNENALGLYTRLGYQVIGESRFYEKRIV